MEESNICGRSVRIALGGIHFPLLESHHQDYEDGSGTFNKNSINIITNTKIEPNINPFININGRMVTARL